MAFLSILTFHSYMRPGVALRLLWKQVVPPIPGGTGAMLLWSMVLHMRELLQPSKTGGWDESLYLADSPRWAWFAAAIARGFNHWSQSGNPEARVASFSLHVWTDTFRKALRAIGVDKARIEQFVLYMLRHGGAADDLASSNRDLPGIKKRGAWRTDSSVARYSKSVRLNQQVASLSAAARAKAAKLLQLLPKLLCS